MTDLRLTFAMSPDDRMLPLINGEVKPDGITLEHVGLPGGNAGRVFYDQIKFQRYDVAEMSMSSTLRMRSVGWPYLMLPVFNHRQLTYAMTYIRKGSGIRQGHPEDLKGKRVGLQDYQQTLGLWTRGILEMEFGIKPEDMVWYQERSEHFSHTGASADAGLSLPKGVTIHHASTDLKSLMAKGELDAIFGIKLTGGVGSGMDRPHIDLSKNADIITLFSDPRQEAIRFYKKHGVFPTHHTTVVRESILKEQGWVATSLMEAFEESKRIAVQRLRQSPPSLMIFGEHYLKEVDATFGTDPYHYGIKANARDIEMVQTFSVQQGLTERKQPLDEIFPKEIIYREEQL